MTEEVETEAIEKEERTQVDQAAPVTESTSKSQVITPEVALKYIKASSKSAAEGFEASGDAAYAWSKDAHEAVTAHLSDFQKLQLLSEQMSLLTSKLQASGVRF